MRSDVRAHWARIRVLFTVVVSIAILSTLVYLLSGGGLLRAKAVLHSYFEDSGALEPGADVHFQGVKIGKVASVKLTRLSDPHRTVVVTMRVDRRFLSQIPVDSKSEIDTANVLGNKFIEINRGESPTPVQDGAILEHMPATGLYVSIDVTTFASELRSIDAALKDIEEGKGSLGQFVMTDAVYQDLLTGVTNIQKNVDAAMESKSTLGNLLYSPEKYQNVVAALERLDASLAEIQAGRGAAGEFLRKPELYDKARASLSDLRKSLEKAEKNPALQSDAAYQSWNRQLHDLMQTIDDFNAGKGAGQLVANSQVYESLNGAMQELQSTLRDVRSNPKKYLHLKVF